MKYVIKKNMIYIPDDINNIAEHTISVQNNHKNQKKYDEIYKVTYSYRLA